MPIGREMLQQILKHFLAIRAGQMFQIVEDDDKRRRVQRCQRIHQETRRLPEVPLRGDEVADFPLQGLCHGRVQPSHRGSQALYEGERCVVCLTHLVPRKQWPLL